MNITKIETNYWEDRPYDDEAQKRSVQFRVLADKINELVEILEEK